MKTVLVVLGTRPEGIKLAPVIKALQASRAFDLRVCVTGQHREMLDSVLGLFKIVPDYDLGVMMPNQKLAWLTERVLREVARILESVRPDWVVVQGDTTTAMAASLAAFYQGARVAHVEAGLRTSDKRHPFPEEVNRRIVDTLADIYFAPTERARRNLLREGAEASRIFVTGNTVVDALFEIAALPYTPSAPISSIPRDRRLILLTAHRRESFGAGLASICAAVRQLADERDDIHVTYPVHLNPNVLNPVRERLGAHPRITLIPPVDYSDLVHLMRRATLILTDSGGIQEEAPSFGKPVLVLREVTERPEAVEAGCARVVGTDTRRILAETRLLLDDEHAYQRMARVANPFGDGHAGERIANLIRWADETSSGMAEQTASEPPRAHGLVASP